MVYPPLLKPGDCVGIVAPGRKIKDEIVAAATAILESYGLIVRTGAHIFSEKHPYFGGSDIERRADMQTMIDDSSVKTIICARGGYGTTRIVDAINFNELKRTPKWLVGFSDITAMHLKCFQSGIASIHGLMPILFSDQRYASSLEKLRQLLFAGEATIETSYREENRLGEASAEVVGGNLSLIADSLGTKTEIDTEGKILILEEVDEYRYRVDRMLNQLKRAGKLDGLAGLVIGHFTDIKETESGFGEREDQIILNAVKEYDYPIAFGFPTGHHHPNEPWIHGGHAAFHVGNTNSRLTFLRAKQGIV